MAAYPYANFKEWEQDMDRFRQHPQDVHLIKHIRSRVQVSPQEIQREVHEYLQDMAFSNNPVPMGKLVAERTGKMFFIRDPHDPWFHV